MPSKKLSQNMVDEWLAATWRAGYARGLAGGDDVPSYNDLKPQEDNKSVSHEQKSLLAFNPLKCEARIERYGYGVQCTRAPLNNDCLCKTHGDKFRPLTAGLDIPYGRFNKDRPTHELHKDEGNKISWHDTKIEKKSKNSSPMIKVGEMRDYLATRIPNSKFKGMKKKELMELYNEEKIKEVSSSSESDTGSPSVSPSPSIPSPDELDTTTVAEPGFEPEPETESVPVTASVPETESVPETDLSLVPETESVPETDLSLVPESLVQEDEESVVIKKDESVVSKPQSVSEYKKRFAELGIDTSGLKGLRSFKEKYDEHINMMKAETEDFSDDDLEEDTSRFAETDFEGVDYLEDEDTGKLWNLKGSCVGKWNADVDDILWSNDEFKSAHEEARP